MHRFRAVLLFGAPGVGKGTQGRILGAIPGLFHLSSGEVFRALAPDSPAGRQVSHYTDRGELVPDELTIQIVRNALDSAVADGQFIPHTDVLLLDGIPRNLRQAEILDEWIVVLRVIYLACSDDRAMVKRLQGRALKEGRPDDTDETVIRRRFEVYRQETAPVLAHYPQELLHRVDALPSPAEVLREILDDLIPVLKERSAES